MASHSHVVNPFQIRSPIPGHAIHEVCPVCEQTIPHDRFDEINERIEAREKEREAAAVARLRDTFEAERTKLLEGARAEAAQQVASAKAEATTAAESAAKIKIEAAEQASRQVQTELRSKVEAAEAAIEAERNAAKERETLIRSQAEQSAQSAAKARIDEILRANAEKESGLQTRINEAEAEAKRVIDEAEQREVAIRTEAVATAENAAREKLEEAERVRLESEATLTSKLQEAEAARTAAEEAGNTASAELEKTRIAMATTIEQMNQDAIFKEIEIRAEAKSAAEKASQEKVSAAELARTEAESKRREAEDRVREMETGHATVLADRLREQREAMETDKSAAVNAAKSAAYEEKLKLSTKVEELQRQIDKKTAEELGEGAEIDLFEALKAEFEGDRIERVNRGLPGADIIHTVMHNGRECGKIVYDSKNHSAWRNDFVSKLASDQLAAKAEHAILASRTFPQGARQLTVRDGVIIASPARVVALMLIVRQHIIRNYTLRQSNEAKTQKTAELYAFITSERCTEMLKRIDTHAEDLLDLQLKEQKAHQSHWKAQGELIRKVQKVRAEVCSEIDIIIGTAPEPAGE